MGKRGQGYPKTFHADNGKEFTAHIAQQLYNKLGIHFSYGWAENHQSNPVERFHQTYKLVNSLKAEGESNFVEGVKTAVILYNQPSHRPGQPTLGEGAQDKGTPMQGGGGDLSNPKCPEYAVVP